MYVNITRNLPTRRVNSTRSLHRRTLSAQPRQRLSGSRSLLEFFITGFSKAVDDAVSVKGDVSAYIIIQTFSIFLTL